MHSGPRASILRGCGPAVIEATCCRGPEPGRKSDRPGFKPQSLLTGYAIVGRLPHLRDMQFPIFGVGWHWDPLRVLRISADKPRGTDTEGSLGCSPLHSLIRWALRSWPGPNVRGHLVQLACIFRGGPWGPERSMELPEVNMPGLGPDPGLLTCQLAKKKTLRTALSSKFKSALKLKWFPSI